MKRWIWHIKNVVAIGLLILVGCSQPQREETIVFEDDFYADAQCRYEQLIEDTLPMLANQSISPLDILPGLYGAARMFWITHELTQLNNAVQKELVKQYALYADIPNMGAGIHLYSALLAMKEKKYSQARQNLQRFERESPDTPLKQWARELKQLVSHVQPVTHQQKIPNGNKYRAEFVQYYLKPWLAGNGPVGILRRLNSQQLQDPQRWWREFARLKTIRPLFSEEVTDTSRRAIIKKIVKYYFNPFLYESLEQVYQKLFLSLAERYVHSMELSWIQELDSTDIRAFFYLNVYLAETAALFKPQMARQFIKIMKFVPVKTPLMARTISSFEQLLDKQSVRVIQEIELDAPYSPFYTGYLQARFLRLLTHIQPEPVKKSMYETILKKILDYAPSEAYRNQSLALLGESACPIARWEIAIRLLSPTFDRGYDVSQVDPVKMVYMANAYFHLPLQMDGGKGILEQLVQCYPYVKPLRYDYIRVLSFLYAK